MSYPSLTVPENVSFEQAIALTQTFLDLLEKEELSEEVIQTTVNELVKTENGARGFFVTYLTDKRSVSDRPTSGVIEGLQTSPEIVSELLVKNVAMSTAMAITHTRNQNLEMAGNSQQVKERTTHLIAQLQLPEVKTRAKQLCESAQTGTGEYQSFLERWGYDAEQKQAIQDALGDLSL
ncbi:MAG: hypothetical protein J7545_15800 [Roseofilum sp. SBFL]|uniref:hypothetical protein n=1 Tax=unclassified Roseofilum TaxID=2620099 RepID=UPI001B0BDFD2|nr:MULTISPECIES: hypothetical protein [unclassified Roseofilum]MBP0012084.1 hypothetical protein [Roseofilum sp. SID3]MBP0024593.1 hypothetical protein [Roseofilum sp. SID2]MBP0039408.1 hypothetical protein [Roseofilum sp. SID1]MBP0043412.1 hypothetical protein [Roseofilum sp. SBFL]